MKDLKIKVGPIGLLDMLKFKNQVAHRDRVIESGEDRPVRADFAVNRNATALHPEAQSLIVDEIIPHSDDVKTFVFREAEGKQLAPFRAGQYLSFPLEIDGSLITRPISISSSPKQAREGKYAITVKRAGFASDYLLDNLKVEDPINASAPLGNFYYSGLRDARHVIGLAGGSGITPFLSMAQAIADGDEDFELTLLYGSRTADDILFKEELDELEARSNGKFRVIHVLSHEEREGFEHGFMTETLIRKYMKNGYNSFFICGPQVMYQFVTSELEKINPGRKWIRRELFGASKTPWELPGYPAEKKDQKYTVRLHQCGETHEITAQTNESLLSAIERAGLKSLSECRSGECGWCRSRLISGDVFIPDETDGRRAADHLYGYIHPCVSYPISDLEIEIPSAQ